ncbi:hypothetical protein [Trebonia kvetii]|uniref:hypothetical protein n=1 Tax=Trebonia kvetii TaxID=2480626 RepID=UPI001FEAE579|nr:hypothetical protein [Trebonia kvetii]
MNSTPSRWSVSCCRHRGQPPLHVVEDAGEGQAPLLTVLLLLFGELEDRDDEHRAGHVDEGAARGGPAQA